MSGNPDWIRYGYRRNESGALVSVEDEQDALDMIADLHAQGAGLRRIATALRNAGHKPRGAKWHVETIRRLIGRLKQEDTGNA